jgi:arylsulfatase
LFAGGEGNLRTPCILRWPGHVPADAASDEIVHITDWFTTLLSMTGCAQQIPQDRVIDGVDQSDFLTGRSERSRREGYLYWMGETLYGVKWRHFKLKLVEQKYSTDPPTRLSSPHIVNLLTDPQEREPFNYRYTHSWTAQHFGRLMVGFHASVAREPLIPSGAPLDHVPHRKTD